MSEPRVWHINDSSRPADAVYIGRAMPRYGLDGTPWGNPYKIVKSNSIFTVVYADGALGPLGTVINRFAQQKEATDYLIAICRAWANVQTEDPDWLAPLVGHDLVCWCAKKGHPLTADDPLVCHGQVLLRLIRERETQ